MVIRPASLNTNLEKKVQMINTLDISKRLPNLSDFKSTGNSVGDSGWPNDESITFTYPEPETATDV